MVLKPLRRKRNVFGLGRAFNWTRVVLKLGEDDDDVGLWFELLIGPEWY